MSGLLSLNPEPKSRLDVISNLIKEKIMLYLAFRGNKICYLRWIGAKIGDGCLFLNRIEGFGSEPWLIEIKNRVILAAGVQFITHDGASRLYRADIPGSSKYGNRFGRILIQDDCFIGLNSIILHDVEIGPSSIVGVGSIVNKNIPPRMVYAGVPAKPICTLDEYLAGYQEKMIEIKATNRVDLRRELTIHFWNEER